MHFHPLPAIVISSLAQPSCAAALGALEYGAVDVLAKPGGPYSVGELRHDLAQKVRAAAAARLRPAGAGVVAGTKAQAQAPARLPSSPWASGTVLAIGASTGGTEAIAKVLARVPAGCPGVVVTQHIPAQFSRAFAKRLNEMCAIDVKEAEDGDTLRNGLALIAPGDLHMLLRKSGGRYYVSVKAGPRVCYQRPSVDVLFSSVAESAGRQAVGALLTGMGNDGAQGMLKMRRAGAMTIAQNEATCVVYGMPREAVLQGGAAQVLPLDEIAAAMLAGAAQAGTALQREARLAERS
jgi:two-component system chemotaxis response regulator CheB